MAPKDASQHVHSHSDADEITGHSALPMSRIKKIIQLDEDIVQCSNNATFLISVATEMFIQYLAEQGHNVVKSERKPRKNIQYKDLATAVSRIDNLEFLADVIPKTTTYKQFKEKKAKEAAKDVGVEKGQRTLNGAEPPRSTTNGDDIMDQDGLQAETKKPSTTNPGPVMVTHASGSQSTLMVDRTVESRAAEGSSHEPDVEMTD